MGSMSHMRQESPGFSRGEEFKMIEDTIHDIEESVNKDERKTESLTETLSRLMDVYSEMLGVLEDDDMTVNPRLHYRMYPTVRAYIRDSCNRCQSAVERLAQLASVQDELDGIECYANGEVDFDDGF